MALREDEEPVSPMLAALRNKISRLADGSSIVQGVKGMSGEDQAAIATSFVPGVGDVAGAYADYKGISENWARMNALSKTAAVGAAALGAVPFLPSRSQMHAGGAALQDAVQKIKAYHGSPHDFDRFSTSQIGTGEGAQAYGHGLYFAESEDVARGYKSSTNYADKKRQFLSELPEDADIDEVMDVLENTDTFSPQMRELVSALAEDDWLGFDYPAQAITAATSKNIDNFDASPRLKKAVDSGSMYQVEIDASPDEFLDWDLPLSEQSAGVADKMDALYRNTVKDPDGVAVMGFDGAVIDQKANHSPEDWAFMEKAYKKQGNRITTNLDLAKNKVGGGEGYHSALADQMGGQDVLSDAMNQAGIKGIRYKDGFSRGADGGTSNYVVFDENLISIARKYGIAIPAAAAMLARQTGQNPEDMYEEDEA